MMTTTNCKLTAMFVHQSSLMDKYHEIEKNNGGLQTELVPVDIHSREGQARLKDFAWRITEEIVEASVELKANEMDKFREEMIDALHFLIELMILSGITSQTLLNKCVELSVVTETLIPRECILANYIDVIKDSKAKEIDIGLEPSSHSSTLLLIISGLGLAMCCLKNRPWKKKLTRTDEGVYEAHILQTFTALVNLLVNSKMSAYDIYDEYLNKNMKNQWRQQEGY